MGKSLSSLLDSKLAVGMLSGEAGPEVVISVFAIDRDSQWRREGRGKGKMLVGQWEAFLAQQYHHHPYFHLV